MVKTGSNMKTTWKPSMAMIQNEQLKDVIRWFLPIGRWYFKSRNYPKIVHEKIELAEKLIADEVEIETIEDGGGCYVAGSRTLTLEDYHKELQAYADQQVNKKIDECIEIINEMDGIVTYYEAWDKMKADILKLKIKQP